MKKIINKLDVTKLIFFYLQKFYLILYKDFLNFIRL